MKLHLSNIEGHRHTWFDMTFQIREQVPNGHGEGGGEGDAASLQGGQDAQVQRQEGGRLRAGVRGAARPVLPGLLPRREAPRGVPGQVRRGAAGRRRRPPAVRDRLRLRRRRRVRRAVPRGLQGRLREEGGGGVHRGEGHEVPDGAQGGREGGAEDRLLQGAAQAVPQGQVPQRGEVHGEGDDEEEHEAGGDVLLQAQAGVPQQRVGLPGRAEGGVQRGGRAVRRRRHQRRRDGRQRRRRRWCEKGIPAVSGQNC